MKTHQIKSAILLLGFAALMSQPLFATIEKVKLQAGSIANAQNLSNDLFVQNSNSNNSTNLGLVANGAHRLPFVININHLVTLTGDWLNTCDRVEILNSSGTIVQTLRDAALTKTTDFGKGKLKFTVPSTRLSSVGNFEIRVRYLIEINGFDVLKCRVVNRGVINSITWVGTNLPVITQITGGERSTLTHGLEYKLQFTGTGFGNSVSLTDLPHKCTTVLGFPFDVISTVVNSTGTVITITMKPGSISGHPFSQMLSDGVYVCPDLQDFVDGNNFEIIGINGFQPPSPSGGITSNRFGPYLIYDFNNNLSITGNLTNLVEIKYIPQR